MAAVVADAGFVALENALPKENPEDVVAGDLAVAEDAGSEGFARLNADCEDAPPNADKGLFKFEVGSGPAGFAAGLENRPEGGLVSPEGCCVFP